MPLGGVGGSFECFVSDVVVVVNVAADDFLRGDRLQNIHIAAAIVEIPITAPATTPPIAPPDNVEVVAATSVLVLGDVVEIVWPAATPVTACVAVVEPARVPAVGEAVCDVEEMVLLVDKDFACAFVGEADHCEPVVMRLM